jgi:DNA-3-methyladenine glycosylase I
VTSYCRYVAAHPEDDYNKRYHDTQYGFALRSDDQLFGRLLLEINQAGLSWLTILKKADNFSRAYHHFDIRRIARYGARDRARLLNDSGIIRNRLKVNAAVENARRILALAPEYASFTDWLDAHHPRSPESWARLFKQTFVFTGAEIVREFLLSTGYLPGAHEKSCPIFKQVAKTRPPWMR